MVLQFSFLNDNYPNHYHFSWCNFYQKYYFCLKIVFNSLPFQKMKSIFRYFNSNANEHLNVRTLQHKKFEKKKMVSMFQSSKHALHYDKSHKILSSFKCNNFPPESVVYVWQKLSSKRKKIKKITKVSTRKSFFENIHVSM